MEDSIIKAISHKENLMCFTISIAGGAVPILHADIFDMYLEETTLKVWLEQKFEEKLITELNANKLKFIKDDNKYAIINILGYRICKDFQFFCRLYKLLNKISKDPFTIQNNGIGVQITVRQKEIVELIQHLHNEFIIGENL